MALAWLPYGASRGTSQANATAPSSPPVRPPALSLRPAVAIPLLLLTSLLGLTAWAGAFVVAPRSHQPENHPLPATAADGILLSFNPVDPVAAWAPQIQRWAARYDLPADLITVVMTLESCGDPSARSGAGALGLFQVMPFHFRPGEDPLDPEVNASRGLAYLQRSLEIAGGDIGLALAGYNGGHGLIARDPSAWPTESLRYVRWGTGILADLGAARFPSPTLQAWLDAGGQSLCRHAARRSSTGG